MKTLKIKILKQDILESNYHRDYDCAITRALKRAGENLTDTRFSKKIGGTENNQSYESLLKKVLGMYGTKDKRTYSYGLNGFTEVPNLPIEDFEHILEFQN